MIKVVIRSHGRDLYLPISFPDKSSYKQLIAVSRDYLDTEFPDWIEAELDLHYYKRGEVIGIKRKHIENEHRNEHR